MAHGVKKTEHCGSKKGRGAFYGHKADAKRYSSKRRRQQAADERTNRPEQV
jgi:hypothetical protein